MQQILFCFLELKSEYVIFPKIKSNKCESKPCPKFVKSLSKTVIQITPSSRPGSSGNLSNTTNKTNKNVEITAEVLSKGKLSIPQTEIFINNQKNADSNSFLPTIVNSTSKHLSITNFQKSTILSHLKRAESTHNTTPALL